MWGDGNRNHFRNLPTRSCSGSYPRAYRRSRARAHVTTNVHHRFTHQRAHVSVSHGAALFEQSIAPNASVHHPLTDRGRMAPVAGDGRTRGDSRVSSMGATFWKFSGGEQFSKATPRWLHVLAPERSMEQTQAGEQEASGENAGGMSKQQVLRYRPANTTLSGRCLGDVWEMSGRCRLQKHRPGTCVHGQLSRSIAPCKRSELAWPPAACFTPCTLHPLLAGRAARGDEQGDGHAEECGE